MACPKSPSPCYPQEDNNASDCEWSSFMGGILPFLVSPDPDTVRPPNSMLIAFIRDAAEHLIEEAELLRGSYCGRIQANVCDIPLILPEGRTLHKVRKVQVQGQTDPGFTVSEDELISLHEKPCHDIEDGYRIDYSYTIPLDDCLAPGSLCALGSRFKIALRHKVLMDLYGMSQMPWHNPGEKLREENRLSNAIVGLESIHKKGSSSRKRISPHMEKMFWDM